MFTTPSSFINVVAITQLMENITHVISALSQVRISMRMDEEFIHRQIMNAFDRHNIKYEHEYKLIPHKRFDFYLDGGLVIEVKKEKPSKITLLNQLNRYTKSEKVKAIIVVLEKSMDLPNSLNEKPIFTVSLNCNWGVAI